MRPEPLEEHCPIEADPSRAATYDDRMLELIGAELRSAGFSFTTVTPATHAIVVGHRRTTQAPDLRDVFGWNRSFLREEIRRDLFEQLKRANALEDIGGRWKARIRYASLDANVFVHSGYPTLASDAVFFGPDSYRFVQFVRREVADLPQGARVFDIGCGSGVAGIDLAQRRPDVRVVLSDVNAQALAFAAINGRIAGVTNVETVRSDVLASVDGDADLIIANPPYMADSGQRIYRDGGEGHGAALSLRILTESVRRLTPRGRLLLYTGTAIVDGRDLFGDACRSFLETLGLSFRYEEIDPDVFGEQLLEENYMDVERIAAVGLVVTPRDTTP
jgi:methylase of polypeptide subunit release factors